VKGLAKLKSHIPGIGWPAIADPVAANLLALLAQLEESQWWTAERLARRQLDQFSPLAQHAWQQSPFFRKRFEQAGLDPRQIWTTESFASIPLLTRGELMQHAEHIHCHSLPRGHGAVQPIQTSGSTGQVVGAYRYREIADIRQYQAIQRSLQDIEIRLVVAPLTREQETAISALVQQALGYPFRLRFSYFEQELPGTQGGKFEEFISLVS